MQYRPAYLLAELRIKYHLFTIPLNSVVTRVILFGSNMHQIVQRLRLRPRPHWGAHSAPQTIYLVKGKRKEGEGEGREGEGREEEGGVGEEKGGEVVSC